MLSVRSDIRAIVRDFKHVKKNVVPDVFRISANRAISTVRTKAVRDLGGLKGIKAKLLRKRYRIRKATRKRQKADLIFNYYRMPVAILGNPRETRRGVNVGSKHKIAGAFIAKGRRGNTVFKRVGAVPRWPISEQVVQLEPEGRHITASVLRQVGRERFQTEFRRTLAFRLRRRSKALR